MEEINTAKKLNSLFDIFNMSEEDCKNHLIETRWGGSPKCIYCKHEKVYYITTRKFYKCAGCKKQFSIKKGTIFEHSNVKLRKWFAAIFLFTTEKKGITSIQLASHINVEQKTAWLMLHKLRKTAELVNSDIQLDGIVEVDEYFGGAQKNRDVRLAAKIDEQKRHRIRMEAEGKYEKKQREKTKKYKRSRKNKLMLSDIEHTLPYECRYMLCEKRDRMMMYQLVNYKKIIVGMVERDIKDEKGKIIKKGKLALTKIGRQKGDICGSNMLPIITDRIVPTAHVMTDKATVYNKLEQLFYKHSTINHSKRKYVNGEITTNLIENVWKHFGGIEKNTYGHFSWKYTDNYLNEFVLRYNNRGNKNNEKFSELFNSAIQLKVTRLDLFSLPDYYAYYAR